MYTMVDINEVFRSSKENPLYCKNECRICLESDGILVNVCGCNGSIKYVHLECNENWRNTFNKGHQKYKKCELCNTSYKVSLKKTKQEKSFPRICCLFIIFMIIPILCFLIYNFYLIFKN